MANKITLPTTEAKDKTLLIGIEIGNQPRNLSIDDSLEELSLLARTAGLQTVGSTNQKLVRPNPKTLIGSGKVEEIIGIVDELEADIVLFDDELSPRHQRELEKAFGDDVQVIDRTALILDIFAQHATTHEGSLQVELAQYEYRLPRLTKAWTHLARQAGGGGGSAGSTGGVGLRGPGEKQLELDRRDIRRRIDHLKQELKKVSKHRGRHRAKRKKAKIPVVALVGYTNAGKSTLLNQLTGADVFVADQLFATLDPTTRRVELPGNNLALFTDTVGFIQKLPTTLVEAFQATLEEITEADLLLHVIDITHPNVHSQAASVLETLADISADHVPSISVLNKIDLLENPEEAANTLDGYEFSVGISAQTGIGVADLLSLVNSKLFENYLDIEILLPFQEGALTALFHQEGKVDHVEHTGEGILMKGSIPSRYVERYKVYEV